MNFYDLDPESQRRKSLRRLFRFLRRYVAPYHPYYRRKFREASIVLSSLVAEADLHKLPVTTKDELRSDPLAFILRPAVADNPPPEGFDSSPLGARQILKYVWQAGVNRPREYSHLVRRPTFRERVRRRALMEWLPIHFHVSTGTTGNPTPATYTHYDLTRVLPALASLLIVPKVRDPNEAYYDWTDRTMNVFPGAPHLAFFTPVLAKTAAGTSTFETFGGHVIPTDRQIEIFAQGGFSTMTAVPSYLVHWLRRALELKSQGVIGPLDQWKRVLVGAEPLSEPLREYIRSLALELGVDPRFHILQSLGMTEMKWAFVECAEQSGIHMNPRYYFWELLDPETKQPVPEGEPGVLVFSHIDWRGTVLLRYWTGDLVKGGMRWQRCEKCGYTFPLVFPPICRAVKDFTKIKGTRVDLTDLVEAVRDASGVRQFQIVLENEDPNDPYSRDMMTVHVAIEPEASQEQVEKTLRDRIKQYTEVSPDRIVFETDEEQLHARLFQRTGIKAEYVVERRHLHI